MTRHVISFTNLCRYDWMRTMKSDPFHNWICLHLWWCRHRTNEQRVILSFWKSTKTRKQLFWRIKKFKR